MTHPGVLHIPGGWNGYAYWMAMTPLPYFNEDLENPSILASHDGWDWVVPNGLRNPLDYAQGSEYHSDPDLALDDDGTMICIYRRTQRSGGTSVRYRTSSDGVRWSALTELTGLDGDDVVSPTIVRHDGVWHMWSIHYLAGGGRTIAHRTSTTVAGPWSAPTIATTYGTPPGRTIWHFTVRRHGGRWLLVASDGEGTSQTSHGRIFAGSSLDGDTWQFSEHILNQTKPLGTWSDAHLYRPSMLVIGDTVQVYYGGVRFAQTGEPGNSWWIGRADVPLRRWPDPPA